MSSSDVRVDDWNSSRVGAVIQNERSSAYEICLGMRRVRSMMKKMNRMGERILPCGRPRKVSIHSDILPFAKLRTNLPVR